MLYSGVDAKVHFDFIAILADGGNQDLLKMQAAKALPEIMVEIS